MAGYVERTLYVGSSLTFSISRYAAKCGLHVILGLYMLFENRRRDKHAKAEGYELPEDERLRLAVEAGMVRDSPSDVCTRIDVAYLQNDVTEHDNKWFRYVL